MQKIKGLPDPSNVLLVAGTYMSAIRCLVSCLIWFCIPLPFVYALSLYSRHLFAIAIRCGNLVVNLPLHSHCLGFGTPFSWLLVSCRFPIVWYFERILHCHLKLSRCKRVLPLIAMVGEVCARRELIVCLLCTFKTTHSKRFAEVGGEV